MENLANNARDQGSPGPGPGLRDALPDRVDIIEDIIAEEDTVGMLFRVSGTQRGSFHGVPPTGRRVEMPGVGVMRVVDGKWVESRYFGDELGMLLHLGAVNRLQG